MDSTSASHRGMQRRAAGRRRATVGKGDMILYFDISEYTHEGMDDTCCGAAKKPRGLYGSRGDSIVQPLGEPASPRGRCPKPNAARLVLVDMGSHTKYLLADEEHVYGAEVKVVKKWERRQTIVGRMLTSIELWKGTSC